MNKKTSRHTAVGQTKALVWEKLSSMAELGKKGSELSRAWKGPREGWGWCPEQSKPKAPPLLTGKQ